MTWRPSWLKLTLWGRLIKLSKFWRRMVAKGCPKGHPDSLIMAMSILLTMIWGLRKSKNSTRKNLAAANRIISFTSPNGCEKGTLKPAKVRCLGMRWYPGRERGRSSERLSPIMASSWCHTVSTRCKNIWTDSQAKRGLCRFFKLWLNWSRFWSSCIKLTEFTTIWNPRT